ncbi:imidazolonepropionase-like domain-containing protein [Nonomuraea typhae]|uniref:Imidazolonepropionase-like domain-containing protein n=1 Tax=Nonomuraea typhae TaxID=2603600 RepID=A0ABW7YLE3_9ACTN
MVHSAPLVLPICEEPIREGGVAVRGDRVLQVGPRATVLSAFPRAAETRWPGMITPGLVDACFPASPPAPGVTAAATVVAEPGCSVVLGGVTYIAVRSESEEEWEDIGRDALITAIREVDVPGAVGIAAHTGDLVVLEDLAVLARTFGLRILVDLERHSVTTLDEAGALGPHCHVACACGLTPGERKLLRLRKSVVAVCPALRPEDALPLLDEGSPIALGSRGGGSLLAQAGKLREHARGRGARATGLDRRLVGAATLGGARALGMDTGPGRLGVLAPGARADLAVFDARGRYPYAALLAGPPCLGTVAGGAPHLPPVSASGLVDQREQLA